MKSCLVACFSPGRSAALDDNPNINQLQKPAAQPSEVRAYQAPEERQCTQHGQLPRATTASSASQCSKDSRPPSAQPRIAWHWRPLTSHATDTGGLPAALSAIDLNSRVGPWLAGVARGCFSLRLAEGQEVVLRACRTTELLGTASLAEQLRALRTSLTAIPKSPFWAPAVALGCTAPVRCSFQGPSPAASGAPSQGAHATAHGELASHEVLLSTLGEWEVKHRSSDQRQKELQDQASGQACELSFTGPSQSTDWLLLALEARGQSLSSLMDGKAWHALIKSGKGTLPPASSILKVAMQVAEALKALHDAKQAHGCLDLHSVLIQELPLAEGGGLRAQLAPSLQLGRVQPALEQARAEGAPFPAHVAPELHAGGTATAEGDVFAFGVLMYSLWTGQWALEGMPPQQLAYVGEGLRPVFPSGPAGCPPSYSRLALLCMDGSPSSRPLMWQVLQELKGMLHAVALWHANGSGSKGSGGDPRRPGSVRRGQSGEVASSHGLGHAHNSQQEPSGGQGGAAAGRQRGQQQEVADTGQEEANEEEAEGAEREQEEEDLLDMLALPMRSQESAAGAGGSSASSLGSPRMASPGSDMDGVAWPPALVATQANGQASLGALPSHFTFSTVSSTHSMPGVMRDAWRQHRAQSLPDVMLPGAPNCTLGAAQLLGAATTNRPTSQGTHCQWPTQHSPVKPSSLPEAVARLGMAAMSFRAPSVEVPHLPYGSSPGFVSLPAGSPLNSPGRSPAPSSPRATAAGPLVTLAAPVVGVGHRRSVRASSVGGGSGSGGGSSMPRRASSNSHALHMHLMLRMQAAYRSQGAARVREWHTQHHTHHHSHHHHQGGRKVGARSEPLIFDLMALDLDDPATQQQLGSQQSRHGHASAPLPTAIKAGAVRTAQLLDRYQRASQTTWPASSAAPISASNSGPVPRWFSDLGNSPPSPEYGPPVLLRQGSLPLTRRISRPPSIVECDEQGIETSG